jgi:uncharacterized membrane protein YphA (DoxX/SURF4 family)
MIGKLSDISVTVRRNKFCRVFAWICRIALACAFVPAGLKKMVGQPFTLLTPESGTVGYFFDALFQTGFYYQFLGWCQVLAAIMILIPRTRLIGALCFIAILANVLVLTWSVGFVGTKWIVFWMMWANVYLILFDFDRVSTLVVSSTVGFERGQASPRSGEKNDNIA